ncbi:hypothetical protein GCM10023224_36130 [Streptomonospora halophila]|uniref:VanZ-like domain-containing protein n=1 Tax=Streptomonospora halophila TaxID=427369 RepID=A0ABP9GNN1_9ACTN
MGGLFAADAAVHGAAYGVALAVSIGAMGFLRRQHRRFGRLAGWPGRVTMAVLAAGTALAAFAVYPLPAPAADICAGGGAAPAPEPLMLLGALDRPAAAVHAAWTAGALLPAGLLLAYRHRRGAVAAVAASALIAGGVEALQYTGLLGAYPCPYRVAAVDDVLLGACGGLAGWSLGAAAKRMLPRAWPGAAGDLLPPSALRRVLARLLDLAVCWFGACAAAAAAAAARAAGIAVSEEGLRAAALVAFAAVFGAVVPVLRRDRATPGQAASYLALAAAGPPRPAPRGRALVRSALLFVPVTALLATGLGWWALLVPALHASTALVRRDRAGLFDLIARTRTTTRTWVAGGMPDDLMRFSPPGEAPPPAPAGAVPAQR